MRFLLKVSWVLVAVPAAALAQPSLPVFISGNEARVDIQLPGGIGAELTITFEEVIGLTPEALDVSATLVSPLDLGLLARLPGGGQVSVPPTFPVLVRITPGASSVLSYAGVAAVSLHTPNLQLDDAVPLALFKSPSNDPLSGSSLFGDITTWEGRGSYRAGGSTGDFSEFLIVVDRRPIDAVINGKFEVLQAILTEHASSIPAGIVNTLLTLLSQARTLFQLGKPLLAIAALRAFSDVVKAASGVGIPDVWRANDPSTVNVAGLLRSAADTLAFSLDRKTSQ